MTEEYTRRRLLGIVGTGTVVALAGCPGEGNTSTPTPAPADDDETGDGAAGEPTPTATAPPAGTGTATGSSIHPGERAIERHLASEGLAWVKLDDVSEQVSAERHASFFADLASNFDFEAETVTHRTGANQGETFDVDVAYVAVDEASDGWIVRLGYLDEGAWQSGAGFSGNQFVATAFAGTHGVPASAVETLFAEDVVGYEAVSEDFPDRFRQALGAE